MAETKLDQILKRVDSMPPLPATAMKVIEIANDPNSSVADMDKVITMDAIFSAKVLKMVNSAYFGLRDKIVSTSRAIAHLGMNTVKNLVLCAVVVNKLTENIRSGGFDMDGFWKHSIACSVATRIIARRMNVTSYEVEDYALAALMHDIGKLVFINFMKNDYKNVVSYAIEQRVSFIAAERKVLEPDTLMTVKIDESGAAVFGTVEKMLDHGYVGRHLAIKWNLPEIMVDVIAHHHFPMECTDGYTKKAVHAVHVADIFCKANGMGFCGDAFAPIIKDDTWRLLGMTQEEMNRMKPKWLQEIEEAKDFLKV